jgi:protein TonB
MTQGGFYEKKRLSPTGIAVVALLHGAAVTALIMAKMEGPIKDRFTRTETTWIPLPKDPPPPPPPTTKVRTEQPVSDSHIDQFPPVVKVPPIGGDTFDPGPIAINIPNIPPGPITLPPPPPPPVIHEPVRKSAEIDSRSALQPPYPASAQREGAEGFVQVRVAIGPDGRVKAVEKVKASRDDFFAATERQALRYWRFKPATIDGKPIESSKMMSVTFRLDEMNG